MVANVNSTFASVVSEQTIRSPPHSHIMLLPREEKIMELFDDEEVSVDVLLPQCMHSSMHV